MLTIPFAGGTQLSLNPRLLMALAETLVEVAQEGTVITYGEIGGKYNISPRLLGNPLGTISRICIEFGYPALSAVAVNQTGAPGEGFYQYIADLLGYGELKPSEWMNFWEEVLEDVWNCEQWEVFLNDLSIELGISSHKTKEESEPSRKKRGRVLKLKRSKVDIDTVRLDIESEIIEEPGERAEGKISWYYGKLFTSCILSESRG